MRFALFALIFFPVACASAQSVNDFVIPFKANPTGPLAQKSWAGGNSKLWGTNSSGNPQSVTIGSGLTLTGSTLTASGAGTGTVTSVAATVPSFLSISGSPITSSGTLAISLSGTALPIESGGTNATSASGARSALGLAIGTNVQAWSAKLDTLSAGFGGFFNGFIFWDSVTQNYTRSFSIANSYLVGSGSFSIGSQSIALGDSITAATMKTALSLNNVENTALSTWAGTGNITSVGAISSGTWRGATVQTGYGGTGLTSFAVGDTIYCSIANTLAKLSGNTTTTQKWLTQTGDGTNSAAPSWSSALPVAIVVACSDETTDLTTGTAKVTFRMPHAMTLSAVRLNVNTAPTGSVLIVDVKESGTTIFSTKPQIATSAKTSVGGAVPGVLSDTSLADDAEITINLDQVGSTIAGKGLKVTLIGTR